MQRACTMTGKVMTAFMCACASYSAPATVAPVDGGVVNEAGIVPDAALYVSIDGKDTNPGTQVLPFRTIAGALASALTDQKVGVEIRVCKGTYAETKLVVRAPVTILGGFNCSSWTRAAGFPNPLAEDPNETRIENAAPDQSTTTLTIQGARDVTVEGFTIAAVAAPKQVSALYVSDAATGYFRKNAFLGGSGVVSGDSTPCITVGISKSAVAFDDNLITGGSGVSTSQPGAFNRPDGTILHRRRRLFRCRPKNACNLQTQHCSHACVFKRLACNVHSHSKLHR
jgi:pectin methylesterase-like acyl-CoA thioesterase